MIIRCKNNIVECYFGKCYEDNKVINKELNGLTIGRCYTVLGEDKHSWLIIDDNAKELWYLKTRFYSIDDERDNKLDLLLEDIKIHGV